MSAGQLKFQGRGLIQNIRALKTKAGEQFGQSAVVAFLGSTIEFRLEDAAITDAAAKAVGKEAHVVGTVRKNGNYTDFILETVDTSAPR